MNKSLLAAAALSALALASPAYAQRNSHDGGEVTDDRERGRGQDRERRRGHDGGREQELLGGAQRDWSPGAGAEEERGRRDHEDGDAARWNAPEHRPQRPQQDSDAAHQIERRDGRGQRSAEVGHDNPGQWRGGDNGGAEHRREDWRRDDDNHGRGGDDRRDRGEWSRGGDNNRDRDDWTGDNHNRDGRGDWNRGDDDRRWNDDDRRRGDWDRNAWNSNRGRDDGHRDWRRDDHGRDWREWHWDRNDHRYSRWRHTHRDFDRPRYRDWRHVRHGYYFDWGYAQIVGSFWGYRYYWWSYDGWRRPHRPWYVGGYLPHWVYWEPVPWDLYWRLPPPPYGCRYIIVDRDILLISLSTGIILDALLYY